MRARLLALALAAHCAIASAGPSPARPEIEALLARLQASGCSFYRNGSWHDGAEARAHLLRKLEWLEDRDLVQTTEQFIDRAATASSLSGKPYLVRCGAGAPVESAAWLGAQMKALRSPSPAR